MARKRVKTTRRTNWLLVVAGCLAVTAMAIAYWHYSSEATIASAPAPRELKIAAAPVAGNGVAPAAPSKDVAAVAPVKAPVKATATKAPAAKAATTNAPTSKTEPPVIRRDPPAANTVERRDDVVPPSAPNAGMRPADTYEAMARISLQKRDYAQAREQMESALAHGGKATFMIVHDHSRGNFEADDPKAACVGELVILADELRFEPRADGDRFSANWADVRDAGSNRFFGSGRGGFHVSINAGGKFKNFNLAPESKDKAEGKLILDLLKAYTRKADRTK